MARSGQFRQGGRREHFSYLLQTRQGHLLIFVRFKYEVRGLESDLGSEPDRNSSPLRPSMSAANRGANHQSRRKRARDDDEDMLSSSPPAGELLEEAGITS